MKQPKWKTVEYSRSQIIKAGKTIKKDTSTPEEIEFATKVIDNWRAAHAFPLHVIYMHLRRIAEGNLGVVAAERLKRLDSIINKLKREPTMSLWAIQDLGGCRLIVPTVDDVYKYAQKYKDSRKRHIYKNENDYIKNPKKSGYRSLHVVYEYHSDSIDTYNKNMLIEIQFRTHLQHLWATAVETMGLFTKEAIKSGQGNEEVTRFFVLASALIAIKENQPIPPNVSEDKQEIIDEIRKLIKQNNYLEFLSGISVAVDSQGKKSKDNRPEYYILVLNYNTRRLQIKSFLPSEFEEASEIYRSIEQTRAESKIDAVLVKVSSFNALRMAYPNYFSDIREFVTLIRSFIS